MCTGIRLKAENGSNLFARTMEWGMFDMHSQLTIVPRNIEFTADLGNGVSGKTYSSKYGFVGFNALHRMLILEGMNEAGLYVGLFYHPDFAKFEKYEGKDAENGISSNEIVQYLLSTQSTTDEAAKELQTIKVFDYVEEALGKSTEIQLSIMDRQGKTIVVNFTEEGVKIFDNPLGVITNAPRFDWHMTNLRNYIGLSGFNREPITISGVELKPLGGGSGFYSLPGDFTPPSRFIRAVAYTQTARKTVDEADTVIELFRILDNFNVPVMSSEGSIGKVGTGLKSATLYTSAWDPNKMTITFHTQHNRRVRQVELNEINFTDGEIRFIEIDPIKEQDILKIDVTK
ncbi:MAG: linear amide C-N hydrolase [Mycoplasmatales bacterium]